MKPPVSRLPSCMQMNQYKGRAWLHRLLSFLCYTDNWGGSLLSVSHIEMMEREKETACTEGSGKINKRKSWQKKHRDSRFPIRQRWNGMWNILEELSSAKCHWAGCGWWWRAGGGAAGLAGDETRSAALASLPRQLIYSCWRLAERKYTPGGLALESYCSTSPEICDLSAGFILGCSFFFVLCCNIIKENM